MKIKGICCTYDKDLDGEIIQKEGIGVKENIPITLEFKSSPKDILGIITKAIVKDDGVHIEGELFSDADKVKILTSNPSIIEQYSPAIGGKIAQRNKEKV